MIGVIDLGIGNFRSVFAKCEQLGGECLRVIDCTTLKMCNKVILPGVGSFQSGMETLNELDLVDSLTTVVATKKIPVLGICLGMQLFTKKSEEGSCEGLGLINAVTKKLPEQTGFHIPHMGWNEVHYSTENPLLYGVKSGERFYFAHSYYVELKDDDVFQTITEHSIPFPSGFVIGNLYGVQFHPERSHQAGRKVLENFIRM
ncbi:imidazole glycerol phosphate synthase subunit HisH [Methanospirillum sp.]|uniref:imidazole glycerol phosphate synthase subunit HisH n=1 Tax=Methanospirillum sp. TaxID=45200 RepID=UPI00359F3983